MRVYRVKVYNIDQIYKIGDMKLLDEIMVISGFFETKEVFTEQPVKLVDDRLYSKIDNEYYLHDGFVLGVNEKDINSKNVVSDIEFLEYAKNFKKSKFAYFINRSGFRRIEQELIDEKKEKIIKKIKKVKV